MNAYEIVFIVRPDVATDTVEKLTTRFSDLVGKQGGKVVNTENWGLRTLAYRINKHRKGYYVMLAVNMPGEAVTEVERQLNLSEDIIRFLTIKVDEVSTEPSVMTKFRKDDDSRDSRGPKSSDNAEAGATA